MFRASSKNHKIKGQGVATLESLPCLEIDSQFSLLMFILIMFSQKKRTGSVQPENRIRLAGEPDPFSWRTRSVQPQNRIRLVGELDPFSRRTGSVQPENWIGLVGDLDTFSRRTGSVQLENRICLAGEPDQFRQRTGSVQTENRIHLAREPDPFSRRTGSAQPENRIRLADTSTIKTVKQTPNIFVISSIEILNMVITFQTASTLKCRNVMNFGFISPTHIYF